MSDRRALLRSLAALPAVVALPALPAVAASLSPDAELTALADELYAVQSRMDELLAANKSEGLDCIDIPGYPPLENRWFAIARLFPTLPASSPAGCSAKARAIVMDSVHDDWEITGEIALSLARDLLALGIGGTANV